jgi:hypothetical protein
LDQLEAHPEVFGSVYLAFYHPDFAFAELDAHNTPGYNVINSLIVRKKTISTARQRRSKSPAAEQT